MKTKASSSGETVRQCSNIKSKKHPDARCSFAATQGEYCARHSKNPTRFQEKMSVEASKNAASIVTQAVVPRIQKWWRAQVPLFRIHRQGPAVNCPEVADNQTDLYTLDSVTKIPLLYRWSFVDSKKHIWIYDARSLSMTWAEDDRGVLLNPYTREPLSETALKSFHDRCRWLRDRKYCLVHVADTSEMTVEQLWHQRLLDVIMKYDMLGYHTCLSWFEELSVPQLALFYTELWELWFYRLQLSSAVKQQVVPNWQRPETLLFKWSPQEVRHRVEKKWWQRTMLDVLEKLVSSATLKEHKTLGALYGITAFAIVSPRVRQFYPWLVEMPGDEF